MNLLHLASIRNLSLSWFYRALAVLTAFATIPFSHAASDRSIDWKEMAPLDDVTLARSLFQSPKNLYVPDAVSEATIESILQDSGNKVNASFHIPNLLKPAVNFWFRIYTQYSTQQVVIFDTNHLDVVYEVIDLRPLADASESPSEYAETSSELIRTTLAHYRSAFSSLASNDQPAGSTREEKIILSKIRHLKHRPSFDELADQLKMVRGQRDSMIKGLVAAETFLPKMEMIFSRMHIPVEITRLSLVESLFNFRALSKVGALGVWQFMPASGRDYLTIDAHRRIDERLSPIKATLAAGKLLLANYGSLGNWPLAIIAYNHGQKNLPRLVGEKYSFAKISEIFENKSKGDEEPALGWASRNYYSEFLAAVYAAAYRSELYGEAPIPTAKSLVFRQLLRRQSGLEYALEKGISVQDFQIYNADIQDLHRLLPKGFWIAIPGDQDDIGGLVEAALSRS
jgi:membrane-bound lytic murein transglycosylase D